jgi:hypothetical protein
MKIDLVKYHMDIPNLKFDQFAINFLNQNRLNFNIQFAEIYTIIYDVGEIVFLIFHNYYNRI